MTYRRDHRYHHHHRHYSHHHDHHDHDHAHDHRDHHQFHEKFIPLWWNRKFQNLSRCTAHNTPTSDAELFSNFRLVSSVYRTWEW